MNEPIKARIDPARDEYDSATGIYVRAMNAAGKWESVDMARLDRESLIQWMRSRGGDNKLAESLVLLLLDHEPLNEDVNQPGT